MAVWHSIALARGRAEVRARTITALNVGTITVTWYPIFFYPVPTTVVIQKGSFLKEGVEIKRLLGPGMAEKRSGSSQKLAPTGGSGYGLYPLHNPAYGLVRPNALLIPNNA